MSEEHRPEFETVTLDPAPSPQLSSTPSSGGLGSFTANALFEAAKTQASQWKDERFKTFRPLGEFFNRSNMKLPGVSEILPRLKQNIVYYQTNYLLVFFVLSIYSALTSPMFLISMIVVGCLWAWSMKFKDQPVVVGGFTIPEKIVLFALVSVSLFIFYLSSGIDVLFWLLCATLLFIFLHALLMVPPVVDEFGFGAPAEPQNFGNIQSV